MHSQNVVLAICTLFVTLTNGFSAQLGKRLDPGERSFPEFARLAEPVIQRRDVSLKRQDSIGAWALRTVKCPDTTNLCEEGFPAMEVCCPKNLVCVGDSFRIACCATESSCVQTASTFPKCGDPSWTLWAGGREHFFCCLAGEIGYITDDSSGACGPSSLRPTGKQVATSLIQPNNNDPPPTSVPDSDDNDNDDDNGNTGQNGNTNQNGNTDSPSSSSQSKSGLATGAIAGIAAGGILLLILAGVGMFFALRAGKRRGAKEALAAFQQQQRSMPGPDYDHRNPEYHNHSGPSTPGVAFGAGNQGKFGQEAEVKPQVMPNVAEKYGEGVQPPVPVASPPPQQHQWNAPQDRAPRYEADTTNVYPNTRYAEMEGYNNQQR